MNATTATAVFAAATAATHWTLTNLGRLTTVNHDGYRWTVLLPASSNPTQAEITGREGYGGTEFIQAFATWGQTMAIVEAAMAATRIH